jgi:hypothetical protein
MNMVLKKILAGSVHGHGVKRIFEPKMEEI